MIADIFLTILTWLFQLVQALCPPYNGSTFSIYPDQFLEAIKMILNKMMILNIFFPMDTVLLCLSLISNAIFWMFTAKLAIMAVGALRGTSNTG
jgi:hypothetical protein